MQKWPLKRGSRSIEVAATTVLTVSEVHDGVLRISGNLHRDSS